MYMKLHELRPAPGAKKRETRVGRGIGSGIGKTSGRGHKGQKARSGGGKGPGFEGGQTPLYRRLPKRGFKNIFKVEYTVVNVGALNGFQDGATVTPESLSEAGIISGLKQPIKILGDGKLEKKLVVKAHKFSRSAVESIEELGGKAEVI
jgi:large subunit ribosomal protein L15